MVDDPNDLIHRLVEVVVDHHVIKRPASLGHMDLALGGAESFLDVFRAVASALNKPMMQRRLVWRQYENRKRFRILVADLKRALYVNLQQHVLPLAQMLGRPALWRAVIVAVDLGV